jgi:hypothetical protein
MRTHTQIVIAAVGVMTVFVVFIYPLTFGLPAPHQKKSSAPTLLALAVAFCALLISRAVWTVLSTASPDQSASHSDRLALICSRLC